MTSLSIFEKKKNHKRKNFIKNLIEYHRDKYIFKSMTIDTYMYMY